ncbi:MAG TPA: DUF4349 domain-containing protein, partial [Flavobacterium sp.]
IIKEGEIRFETSSSNATNESISKSVAEYNGYVSEDRIENYDDKIVHHVTIRVPSPKFEALLGRVSANAIKVDSKNITALDVTEEYIDIEARVKTKKELEDRYKELLQRAAKVEEILTIEKEIGTLREEIESVEGRLKYLSDRVSFSTLTVVFYEKTSSSFGLGSKLKEGIHNGWEGLLWFFVALINLWPFLLITGLLLFFIRRRAIIKRKNRENKL